MFKLFQCHKEGYICRKKEFMDSFSDRSETVIIKKYMGLSSSDFKL